jgi:hypothetical protein
MPISQCKMHSFPTQWSQSLNYSCNTQKSKPQVSFDTEGKLFLSSVSPCEIKTQITFFQDTMARHVKTERRNKEVERSKWLKAILNQQGKYYIPKLHVCHFVHIVARCGPARQPLSYGFADCRTHGYSIRLVLHTICSLPQQVLYIAIFSASLGSPVQH